MLEDNNDDIFKGLIRMLIYHILPKEEWLEIKDCDNYKPKDFENDGFIHFYFKDEVNEVMNAIYNDYQELVLLVVDTQNIEIEGQLKLEDISGSGKKYPHLYTALDFSAVIKSYEVKKNHNKFQIRL